MTYATTPLVREFMPSLASPVVLDSKILSTISQVEAGIINPALTPMYDVPFATPSDFTKILTAKAAALEILKEQYQGGNVNAKPDYIATLTADVNSTLLRLKTGEVRLSDE